MGTGASKARPGISAARYVVEDIRNASYEALASSFAEFSDSERQRVMAVLHTANVSADPEVCRSFKMITRILKLGSTFHR